MLFTKMHGLGNDFIIIDGLDGQKHDYTQLAIRLCDRHTGIGADGLIIVLPSAQYDVRMRIINTDGSEAEMCGNGIRCFAKYVFENGIVDSSTFSVETLAGKMEPSIVLEDGVITGIRVNMGVPGLMRGDIPMKGKTPRVINEEIKVDAGAFRITAMRMGVPHAVIFVHDLSEVNVAQLGPQIEHHPAFPQRSNVNFVKVVNHRTIELRTWERGAGQTLACGTGACASAVASFLNGLTGRKVTARIALGELQIEMTTDETVFMTGPAQESFVGEIAL